MNARDKLMDKLCDLMEFDGVEPEDIIKALPDAWKYACEARERRGHRQIADAAKGSTVGV